MNTVNMANMAPMGGPVGAPMGMMNNGGAMPPQPVGPPRSQPADTAQTRTQLNTYIYEYFLKTNMADCAKAILKSDAQIKTIDPNGRRDEHGNLLGNGLGDDPMDTDSKEDIDSKRIDELPLANLPSALNDSCFLLEWFSIFWDMLNAQKGKSPNPAINQFVTHAQQQSRMRQNQQQDILRQIRPDGFAGNQPYQMMRNMQNGNMMNMKQGNHLPRTAMANSQNNPQAMQMMQQKQAGQMSRDPSDMDGNRPRPASPGSTDNAPSPSKRPRLDGGPFNPAQAGMMANGRPVGQGMPGQQTFTNQSPSVQAKTIATYAQNLSQHHNQHMPNKPMPNTSGPQAQGSPMVPQGPDGNIQAYYNAEMGGPGGMRPGPGGNQAAGGSNHALQDYQMQLMLLEQQNKKRLMMARQEQDGIGMGRDGGPGGPGGPGAPPGANAPPFQGTSPPGGRTGASPNPSEQMKRNAQQMSGGMGSPIPEGQNRSSPNPVNFMGGNMDPNMAPNFFKGMPGADGNMMAAQMNGGMRPPPSSHPQQHFNGQAMNQQQMMARQQAGNGPQMQWQQGAPNGNPMGPQGPQAQPVQGTPQQRAMPPPSAPAAANANQRNQTASPQVANAAPPTPQQSTKANPKKKDTKNSKGKAATQKKSASNLNSGATPAAEAAAEPEPPTPATPITPVNPQSFTKPGAAAAQVVPNGQPAPAPPAAAAVPPPSHPDPTQNGAFMDNSGMDFVGGLDFANPLTSDNVLTDFDFDSFLHDGDQEAGTFDFSAGAFGMEGTEIGTE